LAEPRNLHQAGAHRRQRAHQPHGGRLHLQDGRSAARRHHGREARELDRIAQSLLGMEQHPPAFERLTLPAGLVEHARPPVHLAEAPARLVSRPAA